jgi:gamma-glutamyltranspeptidase / glutathione hydrolase
MATMAGPAAIIADAGIATGPPRDVVMAQRGIVASANVYASEAGLDAIRRGGNAVDAAVAAAAVLCVVEPRNGHLGGDTFMQIGLADKKRVVAINGSGAAPAAATLERYRAMGGIPEFGLLASTVPGTVSAWALALERFGSKSFAELLEPAIWYAERGVPVTKRLRRIIENEAPFYAQNPDAARVFLPGGDLPAVGTLLPQPGLAASLRRIAEGGRDAFYHGDLAAEMVAASDRYGGLFAREDFAAHRGEELKPLAIDYRGYTVHEQPPVSQGLIVLLALNILAQFDLAGMAPGSAEVIHLQLEALKLAFADRLRYLGDPWFVEVPLAMLLSEKHAREQAARIDRRRASPQPLPANIQPDTTSMVLADGDGNMVSYIHSLFSGARVILGETGVLMNSRLLGFTLDAGDPNCLAPGKRPVHTLNTYVVSKAGEPWLVGGTPGAHWQVQTNLQLLVNLLDFGMGLQGAIEAPRFTVGDQLETGDPTVKIEARIGEQTVAALRAMGHPVEVIGAWDSGGAVQLIARDAASGLLRGATEARRPGNTVVGF